VLALVQVLALALVLLVPVLALKLAPKLALKLESRHRSSQDNSPASNRGLHHTLPMRPKVRSTDSNLCIQMESRHRT